MFFEYSFSETKQLLLSSKATVYRQIIIIISFTMSQRSTYGYL